MLNIIETPFGLWDMYHVCINAGIVITFLVQIILLKKTMKQWRYLFLVVGYYLLLFFGQYASAFVRCANDGALDGKMNLWRGVTEQVGTHFMGHVAAFSILLLPLLWIMSSVFMEPDQKTVTDCGNIFFLCLPIQHIFNRLGCLCRGCCYGIAYDGPFAITLPCNKDLGNQEVFPSQILEIVGMVLVLVTVVVLYRKGKNCIGAVLIGFAITFFISEFFMKNPYAVKHLGLTFVQYVCIAELLLGILYYVLMNRRTTKQTTET